MNYLSESKARELQAVITLQNAINLIYTQFGDPLYDRDPRLVQGIELLQEYCMSKESCKLLANML